jgi:hypothetical protein
MSGIRIKSITRLPEKGPRLELRLMPAPEEDERAEAAQAEFRQVEAALEQGGNKVMPQVMIRKSIGAGSWLSGDFIVQLLGAFGIGSALTAWISAKLGRKVRIKIGDLEAEASTIKELETLLEKANEIRKQMEQPDDEGAQS